MTYLQDWVCDQYQRRQDTSEQTSNAFIVDHCQQRTDRARSLRFRDLSRLYSFLEVRCRRSGCRTSLGLACGHASVDDPDWVCAKNCSRASQGASQHGLNGREAAGEPAGSESPAFEEGAGPFIPWWEVSRDVAMVVGELRNYMMSF